MLSVKSAEGKEVLKGLGWKWEGHLRCMKLWIRWMGLISNRTDFFLQLIIATIIQRVQK